MIKVAFKRILAFLPYVAAYFLALGVVAMATAFFGENVLFKDGSFSAVKVACYVPADSSLNAAGFSFISNMNSIENTVSFTEYDSEEEVRDAVDNDDVSCGLIIPDNFASGIFSGENPEVELVFKSADTFDEHVVNDVMLVLANDLGVGQASTQTAYSLCVEYNMDNSDTEDLAERVRMQELGYALDRMNIFDYKTTDVITEYTLTQQIAAAALIYVFLLSIFVFAYFCKGSNPAFVARAKLSGISPFCFFIVEALSVAVMMYAAYVLLGVGLLFTDIGLDPLSFVYMFPIITIIAVIVTGISYMFRSPVSTAYISFAAFTVLMYLAGGLLPMEFLPKFIQELSVYNPLRYLIDFTMEAMFL